MIKTVKVKKKFRLDELIKYVRDNGVNSQAFVSDLGRASVYFDSEQRMSFGEYAYEGFGIDRTFTVEVEGEIDYDTVFGEVYRVTKEGEVTSDKNKSIGECLDWKDYQVQIFAMLDGRLELIWEAG